MTQGAFTFSFSSAFKSSASIWPPVSLLLVLLLLGCGEALPADVADYREECTLMNGEPLPVTDDDPHQGLKNVYACNVPEEELFDNQRPFSNGTIIVKESMRSDAGYVWLVATARKESSSWRWDEYTRNFEDEEFIHIPSGESVCIDCHRGAERSDWIFTLYTAGP